MQLTTYTDYALRTLIYLVPRPGETVSTREIAGHYSISLNHLTKVVKFLTQKGWLMSVRGTGGGVSLAPHTSKTKVGDIVRDTENTDLVECFHPPTNTCPIHRGCRLKPILHQARQAFLTCWIPTRWGISRGTRENSWRSGLRRRREAMAGENDREAGNPGRGFCHRGRFYPVAEMAFGSKLARIET